MEFIEDSFYMEYSWNIGKANSLFFDGLRNKKIIGLKCPKCKKVYVPPREVCPQCLVRNTQTVEVGETGTITSITEVKKSFPNQPKEVPYQLALIKLDGADTNLLHIISGNNLKIGSRVRIKWEEERIGDIFDIEFVPI